MTFPPKTSSLSDIENFASSKMSNRHSWLATITIAVMEAGITAVPIPSAATVPRVEEDSKLLV